MKVLTVLAIFIGLEIASECVKNTLIGKGQYNKNIFKTAKIFTLLIAGISLPLLNVI